VPYDITMSDGTVAQAKLTMFNPYIKRAEDMRDDDLQFHAARRATGLFTFEVGCYRCCCCCCCWLLLQQQQATARACWCGCWAAAAGLLVLVLGCRCR
jgi:hypothetical protein